MIESPSVVLQYQRALESFRRQGGGRDPLLKRMSELISLLDFTTTLSSSLSGDEILEAALLMVMGELQASRGCLLVRSGDDRYRVRVARGLAEGAPREVALPSVLDPELLSRHPAAAEAFDRLGLEVIAPIFKRDRCIAALGLGPRAEGRPYGAEEGAFLRSVAACAATPIENGLIYEELRRLNRSLSVKVFQLHNLFDLSRELVASFDEDAIRQLVTTTLMGHLMVSRAALYLRRPEGLVLAHARGLPGAERPPLPEPDVGAALDGLLFAAAVGELPPGALRDRLRDDGMALAVPVTLGQRVEGVLAVGGRASGAPFEEEDREFAQTLARQALAALESVRLHRVQVEKQRQDRELQIAHEIQRSLFPSELPAVPGFDVAATSRSCYEVGGDHYDFIPLEDGRLACAVADVSGKGTPASILMASVHASLRALAGSAPIPALMERLNRFLFESTQANKYATLFYGELDPAAHRLTYANAGHVPPYRISGDSAERLRAGGPALGMLEGVRFEAGEATLGRGDVLAVLTDGITEALSPDDREFGDERVVEALRRSRERSAAEILEELVAAVESWTGERGCSDDLTALVLKAV